MAITDYIPNIFGYATPTTYEGLLGLGLITPEQVSQAKKTANIQGLLGAGLALAQGMSKIGPHRSAAENIFSALSGGFGAAGGAYQQGLQNIAQQQQLQSAVLAQQQAANKVRSIQEAKRLYPDIAPLADIDPNKFAEEVALRQRIAGFGGKQGPETPDSLRAQAQAAYMAGTQFKPYGDALMEKANRLEIEMRIKPTTAQAPAAPSTAVPTPVAPAPAVSTDGEPSLPPILVTEDTRLYAEKNMLIEQNRQLASLPTEESRKARKANLEQIAAIDDQLKQLSAAQFDWANIEKEVPESFKGQVKNLKSLAEGGYLPLSEIRTGIQNIYTQVQESAKGMRIDGLPGNYAVMKYGTADQTKLNQKQLADVIAFANAPTADQYAQLQRESQRTQYETGRASPVPVGRSQFLANVPAGQQVVSQPTTQQVTTQPTPTQQVTTQPTTTQPVVTQPAPRPVGKLETQPAPTQPAPTQQAPAVSKVIDPKVYKNPLISRPDSEVPPKKKQELIQAQPGLIGATNYTIKNIVDARNAAKSLLDNPSYIDALSGMVAPAMVRVPGTDAYTANEILQNILGRSFISEIQEMRSNSPTGGAVGNVAVAEMNSLSKIRGALTVGMNKDELRKQLESYIANANRALKTIPNDYARTYGYSGEFDDLLSSEVVSPKPTSEKLPPGVKVRRK